MKAKQEEYLTFKILYVNLSVLLELNSLCMISLLGIELPKGHAVEPFFLFLIMLETNFIQFSHLLQSVEKQRTVRRNRQGMLALLIIPVHL